MSVALEADSRRDDVFLGPFPIHRACRDGDLHGLISLSERLSNQAHLTAEDSCFGWTPIHWAAHYGQLECVVHLVQMGCEVNAVSSRFSQTPAHTAAFGGHPRCVVWLSQAGADINRQDCVGETPIHKAARSGSLECIQVLLIAGAEPHLRNSSGQTAADLAHAHGFHECFVFMSSTRTGLQQLRGLQVHSDQNGDSGAPFGQVYGKRCLPVREACHTKKARMTEGEAEDESVRSGFLGCCLRTSPPAASVQRVDRTGPDQEEDNMNVDLGSADDIIKALPLGHHPQTSDLDLDLTEPVPLHSADMCGSLHLSSSPGSRVLTGEDFLSYGHHNGFGDTAEDPSDRGSFQSESGLRQAVCGAVQLYHGP